MKYGNKFYLIIKRLFDILCGLIGLIVLIPISLIIKLISMFNGDFDSIFFVQNRIGLNGKEFKFYKYRSMVKDADKVLADLLKNDKKIAKEYKKYKKIKNDPRITKVGRMLRRTSIDELPQMLNVLIGNMSLVGNRPYLPREKDDMGDKFDEIVKTKPGLTGYWQVSGKENSTFERRLEMESYYSNNISFLLDVKILFSTVKAVLIGHGADE